MANSSWQEVIDVIVLALIVGNLFAAIVGVVLMIAPGRLASWSRLSDKWVSTGSLSKPLDTMWEVDSHALRRPRLVGMIVLVGAVFILVQGILFASRTSAAEGGRLLAGLFGDGGLPLSMWEVLWMSLLIFLMLGAILALVVGTVALIDPAWLARFAALTNRWISTRRGVEGLDTPHYGVDSFVRARPRLWGAEWFFI